MARGRLFLVLLAFLTWKSTTEGVRGIENSPLPSSEQMMLPLFFSPTNSSSLRMRGDLWRRELRDEVARTSLYDGLVDKGYYSTDVYIGTPPKKFRLIVDTGSTVTYVPCSTCSHCGYHQDPRFHPNFSSTYQPLKCSMSCTCNEEKTQCTYERQYAEMSSSSGVLGEDIISFGKDSSLKAQPVVFGCENIETGDLYSQNADGIMGLGRGQLSIMDQLVKKHVISDSFSLCYGGMDIGGGVMVLGEVLPPHGMVYSHSNPSRSQYYNIELKSISVAGKPLHLSANIFDADYGTILDSGTTFAYLPNEAFEAFKNAIMKHLKSPKLIPGGDPKVKDVCFSGIGSDISNLPKSFPEVSMDFKNGQGISLSPENYLFRHSKVPGAYCLGIFANKGSTPNLLGGIIVRNMLVSYDRKNNKIGFLKTNCSELHENMKGTQSPSEQNKSAGTTPPASPESQHSTQHSPTSSTNGFQGYSFTDKTQLRSIRLDIYFSLKYSEFVPCVKELTEVMSDNLSINVSQIRILSFMPKENGSSIRWIILPVESNDFISSSKAMVIISHLNEHAFHLPRKFGSYQLVEWKLELMYRRTWWQRHIMAMVLGALAVVIIASSVFVIWFWYKRRHRLDAYRPVDAPMQELQLS